MSTPRFSVIVPTHNRLAKLRRALASLEQQSLRSFELILVDDGSTDGTADYVASGHLAADFPGIPEIRALRNEPGVGAGEARNQALVLAQGELIAFLDDDDVWLPECLEEQARRLDRNPSASACVACHLEFDSESHTREPDLEMLLEYDDPLVYLMTESFVHSMSMLAARRSAFDQVGLLNPDLSVTHDWDWCIRLLLAGKTLLPPEGPVLVRHEVPGGLVTRLAEWYEEEMTILYGVFEDHPRYVPHRRNILSYRNLLFARLGMTRGELAFTAQRLTSAFLASPARTIRIIHLKLKRHRQGAS